MPSLEVHNLKIAISWMSSKVKQLSKKKKIPLSHPVCLNKELLWQVLLVCGSLATASLGNLHPILPAAAKTVSLTTILFAPGWRPPALRHSSSGARAALEVSLLLTVLPFTRGEALQVPLWTIRGTGFLHFSSFPAQGRSPRSECQQKYSYKAGFSQFGGRLWKMYLLPQLNSWACTG